MNTAQMELMKELEENPDSVHVHEILDKMETYGGSFVVLLAGLYRHGDPMNRRKIIWSWSDYFEQYDRNFNKRPLEPGQLMGRAFDPSK